MSDDQLDIIGSRQRLQRCTKYRLCSQRVLIIDDVFQLLFSLRTIRLFVRAKGNSAYVVETPFGGSGVSGLYGGIISSVMVFLPWCNELVILQVPYNAKLRKLKPNGNENYKTRMKVIV